MDSPQRVASPRTQARQEEMARRIIAERERYAENANASEMGSEFGRHMTAFMEQVENELLVGEQQANGNTSQVNGTRGGRYVRNVNFPGIYGTITQVLHIPLEEEATSVNSTPTSTAPQNCSPPTYTSPSSNLMRLRAHPASRGSGTLPRRSGPRRSVAMRDLRTQGSSSSTLRRRSGVQDLAREARPSNGTSDAPDDQENEHQAIVEDEPESPVFLPPVPQHAELQSLPRMVNGHNPPEPPRYADVGRAYLDRPLPPHLDPTDPVGADFLTAMQEQRRAGDQIQTFAAGLGVDADDAQVLEVQHTLQRAEAHFTTSSARAAAAAANQRRDHMMTNDLLNRFRLAEARLQHRMVAQAGDVEHLEARVAVLSRQLEYSEAGRAEERVRMGQMGHMILLETTRRAHLDALLADRGREAAALARQLEELAENFYGYGQ